MEKLGISIMKERIMERKEAMLKTGYSRILWVVLAVLLCVAPCVWADETIPNDETEYNIPGDFGPTISGSLEVLGTVNLLPGASVEWFVYATETSVVNIKGGTVGFWIDVALGAQVTVYGTGFNLGEGEHFIDYGPVTGFYENGDPINLTFDCQPGATVTLAPPGGVEPITVQIDIKPGSDPNPINPGSNGLVPVAILTTDDFDASTVDPDTVTLAGAEVAVRGKSLKTMARMEDIDGDGDDDLLLQVETQSDDALWESGTVTLLGKTYDGQDIMGTDVVIIVPPE